MQSIVLFLQQNLGFTWVLTGCLLACVFAMPELVITLWPEWKLKLLSLSQKAKQQWHIAQAKWLSWKFHDFLYLVSAGRLWSVIWTFIFVVEAGFILAYFYYHELTWMNIIHVFYVVLVMFWFAYSMHVTKALEGNIKG